MIRKKPKILNIIKATCMGRIYVITAPLSMENLNVIGRYPKIGSIP
jgi:hypothetical protein